MAEMRYNPWFSGFGSMQGNGAVDMLGEEDEEGEQEEDE